MSANEFPPPRQRGLAIHGILMAVLGMVSAISLWLVFQTPVGLRFTIFVLVFALALIPIPILGYRLFALGRGSYYLDRNTLRLVWGLRVEEIPISDIEWVRPVAGLVAPISLPVFRLPGSILGLKKEPDVGEIEFLASEKESLLLVATARRVYAISPENPAAFAVAFQKIIEMGSLLPGEGLSQYPSFIVTRAWDLPIVRYLWLAGALLNIGLLAWVSTLIPAVNQISLGFSASGLPVEPVAGIQLILLPFLSILLYVSGWLAGLFFFRREEQQQLAIMVWASGTLTGLIFLVAVFFIITTPI